MIHQNALLRKPKYCVMPVVAVVVGGGGWWWWWWWWWVVVVVVMVVVVVVVVVVGVVVVVVMVAVAMKACREVALRGEHWHATLAWGIHSRDSTGCPA
jgi:hypothetical protein